jgi:acetoin utilization protein AcuB
MTKPIPQVQKFMTTTPLSVEKTENLLKAAELMQQNHIRHLPVVHQGKVEGILSSTDINLIRSLKHARIEELRVLDCFTPNAYTVSPSAPLNEVMDEMAEKKYGSVIVSDQDRLVGIFTWVDALKATSELLVTRLK